MQRSNGGAFAVRGAAAVPGSAAVLALGAVVALALAAGPAAAQEEPDAASPGFEREDAPMGWRGNADFGYTLTRGNSETTNLSLGARAAWRSERSRWTGDANYLRATDDQETTASRGEAAAQYDYFPTERMYFFGRGAASFNEPAGLDLRLAPSAGVGYQLLEEEQVELNVETGAGWIRDEFADGTSDAAANAVLSQAFRYALSETAELQQSLSYRPKLDAFGDYLLSGEVSLSASVIGGLGLQVTFRDEYDSRPFDPATGEEREQNDITLVTGLTYKF